MAGLKPSYEDLQRAVLSAAVGLADLRAQRAEVERLRAMLPPDDGDRMTTHDQQKAMVAASLLKLPKLPAKGGKR